ncbi:MAG TPA: peptidoglycan-binding domain-containing protein [Methylomirabilota bacterium]|nr:peptidoglycan-binding domain-containing protein [Methylomirabilota bacterium]
MKILTGALALAVAVMMLAGPVFAQAGGAGGGGTTSPPMGTKQPAPSGGTTSGDAAKPESMKPDAMKADRTAGAGGDREQVRAAQEALKQHGLYQGEVDGIAGPKTQSALREFQKKEGLKTTGRLDAETLAKLGVEGKTSPSASPPGPGGAPTPSASPGEGGVPGGALKDGMKK